MCRILRWPPPFLSGCTWKPEPRHVLGHDFETNAVGRVISWAVEKECKEKPAV